MAVYLGLCGFLSGPARHEPDPLLILEDMVQIGQEEFSPHPRNLSHLYRLPDLGHPAQSRKSGKTGKGRRTGNRVLARRLGQHEYA